MALSHKGEWWKEFRAYLDATNFAYVSDDDGRTSEAEAAAVQLRKDGLTPLLAFRALRDRNLVKGPTA